MMFGEELKQSEAKRWKKIDDITREVKKNLVSITNNNNESAEYLWLSGALIKYNIQRMQLFQKTQKIDMPEEQWSEFANQMEKLENKLIPKIQSDDMQEIKKFFKMINSLTKLELLHCKSHSLYISHNKTISEKKIITREKPTNEQKLAKLETLHEKSRALNEKYNKVEDEEKIEIKPAVSAFIEKQNPINVTEALKNIEFRKREEWTDEEKHIVAYDVFYLHAKETKQELIKQYIDKLRKKFPSRSGAKIKNQALDAAEKEFSKQKAVFDEDIAKSGKIFVV